MHEPRTTSSPLPGLANRAATARAATADGAWVPRSCAGCGGSAEAGCRFRTGAATSFSFRDGYALLIVVWRTSAASACSRGFEPIVSKRADYRSPANGGVHAGGDAADRWTTFGSTGLRATGARQPNGEAGARPAKPARGTARGCLVSTSVTPIPRRRRTSFSGSLLEVVLSGSDRSLQECGGLSDERAPRSDGRLPLGLAEE